MTPALDSLDRRLLWELDCNGRMSFAELSKRLHVSLPTARNRVQRLLASKAVRKFHTAIDTARLGLTMYELFIKLRTSDREIACEVISSLAEERVVTWLAKFQGAFDIGSACRIKEPSELGGVVDRLSRNFGSHLAKKSLQLNTSAEYLPRSYLVGRPRKLPSLVHLDAAAKPIDLDAVDRRILFEMGNDARLSGAEISRRLKSNGMSLTGEAVVKRIERLETEGPINGYTLVLNHPLIGQKHFKVLFHLDLSAYAELEQFLAAARLHPNVVYIIRTLGEWDLELDIEVNGREQFQSILSGLIEGAPKLIRDYFLVEIGEIHKYSVSESLLDG